MPIYEYVCKGCGRQFEQVVLPKATEKISARSSRQD